MDGGMTALITCPGETGVGEEREGSGGLYMRGVGCNRRRRGEEPVAVETASMELARLAGEPLTVGKEVSLGEPGRTSCDDS